jgi:hypothetical protein
VVRILWFKETSRWSRRGIPLRVVWVSPRQLTILILSFLFGFGLSVPLPNPTVKLIAMASILLAGAVVSFWRVKMLTTEQLIMARLRGSTGVSHGDRGTVSSNKPSNPDGKPEESGFEIVADGPESFTPLSVSGRCRRTKLPRKVSLCVDGMPRPGAESLAIPVNETESSYTIVFLPTAADLGAHDLEVRVDGEEKPVYRVKVDVRVKGARSLEMKKVS